MIKVHIRPRRKQDKTFWCYYSIAGKQFHKNLQTGIKSEALARVKELEHQLAISTENHETKGRGEILSFLNRYWEYALQHKRPATIEIERSAIKHLLHALGGKRRLSDITPAAIEQMKRERIQAGDAPSSVNIYLRHISAILGRAVKWEDLDQNPCRKVEKFKVEKKLPRFLSGEEIDRVVTAAKALKQEWHWVFLLGIYGGLRKREISFARWEWFDFERGMIVVQEGEVFKPKSGRSRTIPMHSKIKEILGLNQKKKGYLFSEGEEERKQDRYRYEFRRGFDKVI
ncbi:MAG: hypothetical protein AB1656_24655 [Candidatus Omnitrophota bacterium]